MNILYWILGSAFMGIVLATIAFVYLALLMERNAPECMFCGWRNSAPNPDGSCPMCGAEDAYTLAEEPQ